MFSFDLVCLQNTRNIANVPICCLSLQLQQKKLNSNPLPKFISEIRANKYKDRKCMGFWSQILLIDDSGHRKKV